LVSIFGRITGGFAPPSQHESATKRESAEEAARRVVDGNAPEVVAWVREPEDDRLRRERANLVLNLETREGGKNRKTVVTAMVSILKR
jgi:hypothetical protein